MSNQININGFKLILNFEPQVSKNGKEIILSGIAKNCKVPEKWINDSFKNHWIYTFKYLENDTFVSFEFDYYENFVGIFKS